jgi:hypothetical protein
LLIHASKVPDPRPQAWAWVTTPYLEQLAALRGGVIGQAELHDCIHYSQAERFLADRGRHLNAPEWYREQGGLYGLVFRQARVLPYFPASGNTFFFPVVGYPPTKDSTP